MAYCVHWVGVCCCLGVAPVSLVANVSSAVVDIPKPVLPAGPVSSLTAARAYEVLEERDTQIRKSKCLSVYVYVC